PQLLADVGRNGRGRLGPLRGDVGPRAGPRTGRRPRVRRRADVRARDVGRVHGRPVPGRERPHCLRVRLAAGGRSGAVALRRGGGGGGWWTEGGGTARPGWRAGAPADLFTRAGKPLFASADANNSRSVFQYDGGTPRSLNVNRPFRMAASAGGKVLAFGYAVHDFREIEPKLTQRFFDAAPRGMRTVRSAVGAAPGKDLWVVGPAAAAAPAPRPPEPSDDFPPPAPALH